MFHLMAVHGTRARARRRYETDRAASSSAAAARVADPAAMQRARAVGQRRARCSIRSSRSGRITLEPERDGDDRHGHRHRRDARSVRSALIEKYHDRRLADRVFDLAWTHSQVVLRQINATEADAQIYGTARGRVLYANPALRAERQRARAATAAGQSGLWGYAISGDLPIVLLRIGDAAQHRARAAARAGARLLAAEGARRSTW